MPLVMNSPVGNGFHCIRCGSISLSVDMGEVPSANQNDRLLSNTPKFGQRKFKAARDYRPNRVFPEGRGQLLGVEPGPRISLLISDGGRRFSRRPELRDPVDICVLDMRTC